MNQDKTFLGTEPVGRLLIKLAVPTVIAQLVNMLYNIVDRIYIGHMPGDGAMALTGVGVCLPVIMIVSAFAALVASGGAPRASIYMGRGEHDTAEKILGGCFTLQLCISAVLTAVLLLLEPGAAAGLRRQRKHHRLRGGLHAHLRHGNGVCAADPGAERLHYRPGLCQRRDADGADRRGDEHCAGSRSSSSGCIWASGARRWPPSSPRASPALWVLRFLSGKKTHAAAANGRIWCCSRSCILPCVALGTGHLHHAGQREHHLRVLQLLPAQVRRRHRRGRHDHPLQRDAVCHAAAAGHWPRGRSPSPATTTAPGTARGCGRPFGCCCGYRLGYSVVLWAVVDAVPAGFLPGCSAATPNWWPSRLTALRIYCGALFLFGIQIACQMTFVSIGHAAVLHSWWRCCGSSCCCCRLIYLMPRLLANQTHGGLHGGAGGRRHRRDVYGDPVCRTVPQGAAAAGDREVRACTVPFGVRMLFQLQMDGKRATIPGTEQSGCNTPAGR